MIITRIQPSVLGARVHPQRFNAFVRDQPMGINQTGLNVGYLQPWVSFKNRFRSIARREHAQDMFDCEPTTSNNGLATEDVGIHGDPFQQFRFIRHGNLWPAMPIQSLYATNEKKAAAETFGGAGAGISSCCRRHRQEPKAHDLPMADAGLQCTPEFVWFGDRKHSVIQHRKNPDAITRVLFAADHLLL